MTRHSILGTYLLTYRVTEGKMCFFKGSEKKTFTSYVIGPIPPVGEAEGGGWGGGGDSDGGRGGG